MGRGNNLSKIIFARKLRKSPTKAEQVLWQFLKDRNFLGKKFRRQYLFRGFILDFYCPEEKLAIELDGSIHLKQKAYDLARQEFIESFNLRFLRINNEDIFKNMNNVLERIKQSLTDPLHDNGEGGSLNGSG